MRIIVNGQQAFGSAVLEALLERGEDVVAVYCAPDKPGGKPDPLKQAALAKGLPVHQPASFKKPEVWQQMRDLAPDLCVMAYVTLIVPDEALNIPTHGTIQYHPSLLPMHRGPSAINWAIIQGDTQTGLTIFWPDDGLDTGPILMQTEVPIGDEDTLGSLYFDKLFPLGVDAMLESVELVKRGEAPKIEQDPAQGSYEGWCRREQVEIDWSRSLADVYNLIRGADPAPGAWTTLAGETLQLFDVARQADSGGQPGEVTAVGAQGITVAAAGGQVLVRRVRALGGRKIDAAQFAADSGLAAGARFTGGAP